MRIPLLFIMSLSLISCTGVKVIDDTWACSTGNVPNGKECAPLPTAKSVDEDDLPYDGSDLTLIEQERNPITVPKRPTKEETPVYPYKKKTPIKTWDK